MTENNEHLKYQMEQASIPSQGIDAAEFEIDRLRSELSSARERIAELETENHDEPERRASVASGCIPADTFIRIRNWLDSEPRKPASNAFTAGIERQLAYAIEHSWALKSLAAKDARIAELEAAIKPFAEFGVNMVNVIEAAWTSNIHRESISLWFGPSDFCAAHRAMIKAKKEQGE